MKDAPKIKGITVELTDGRWQRFSADDLEVVRGFAGEHKQWRLIQFITELSPPVVIAGEEESTRGADNAE